MMHGNRPGLKPGSRLTGIGHILCNCSIDIFDSRPFYPQYPETELIVDYLQGLKNQTSLNKFSFPPGNSKLRTIAIPV